MEKGGTLSKNHDLVTRMISTFMDMKHVEISQRSAWRTPSRKNIVDLFVYYLDLWFGAVLDTKVDISLQSQICTI